MNRKRIFIIVIVIFLTIDAIAWSATYRVATEPSPEEVQLSEGVKE